MLQTSKKSRRLAGTDGGQSARVSPSIRLGKWKTDHAAHANQALHLDAPMQSKSPATDPSPSPLEKVDNLSQSACRKPRNTRNTRKKAAKNRCAGGTGAMM